MDFKEKYQSYEGVLSKLQEEYTNAERQAIIGETITVARNYDASQEIQETFELKLYVMNPTD